jgi:hypothetical protein
MTGNGNKIRTSETYRLMFSRILPLSSFLRTPITILKLIIRTSIVPQMEEDLEVRTFKRPQIVDMKTNQMRSNRKPKNPVAKLDSIKTS